MVNKLIYGVAVDDSDSSFTKHAVVNGKSRTISKCPYGVKWRGMLTRCYSKSYQERQPTYKGCTVCEEWLTFIIMILEWWL